MPCDVEEEEINKPEIVEDIAQESSMGRQRPKKMEFEKPTGNVAQHLKPLYICAHIDGKPVNRVLVDNGAAVNILPAFMMRQLGKEDEDLIPTELTMTNFVGGVTKCRGVLPVELTVGGKTLMTAFFVVESKSHYNALLGRDWIHASLCVPSSLHQVLLFWNNEEVEVVKADNRPFMVTANAVEARYYDDDIGLIKFFGKTRFGRPAGVTAVKDQMILQLLAEEACEEMNRPVTTQVSQLKTKELQ